MHLRLSRVSIRYKVVSGDRWSSKYQTALPSIVKKHLYLLFLQYHWFTRNSYLVIDLFINVSKIHDKVNNKNMVSDISNTGLTFFGSLPYPPLSSKDAKLLLSLSKKLSQSISVSIPSTVLFWPVIKSYEFIVTTNFVQCKR